MSRPGAMVMFHHLFSSDEDAVAKYLGRTIRAADFNEDRLRLEFDDATIVEIIDNGQSCCERRYMTTDDDVSSLVGRKLLRIDVKDGPEEDEGEDGAHETCFVEVGVDDGFITLTTHNEHNGYYGGFALTIREVPA